MIRPLEVGIMRSRRHEWEDRVARWRRSGLTAREFAASIGVNAGTLAHWAWRLGRRSSRRQAKRKPHRGAVAPAMIEVIGRAGAVDNGFDLELGCGRRVHVPTAFDAAALRRLLEVVEERR